MIRLGVCCIFHEAPIRFRGAQATHTARLPRPEQEEKLAALCRHNGQALLEAIQFCAGRDIGAFRINSQIWPLATHPEVRYRLSDLPGGEEIRSIYRAAGDRARDAGIRLSFHPDQFVVLGTNREEVLESSLREVEYQAEVAELVGADVINVHGGGAYGDKEAALDRFARAVDRLSDRARSRLTVENDDRVYAPAELLALCERTGVPFVYDVHHHRILPDSLEVDEVTERAVETWDREPLMHLSSPRDGWDGPNPRRHHDFVDPGDFPRCWTELTLTVDVEAKAKELAAGRLLGALRGRGVEVWPRASP